MKSKQPREILYFADPLCSWCHGFTPVMARLRQRFADIPFILIMGGLRAFNTRPMDEEMREYILGHWRRVESVMGAEFKWDDALPPGFIYDTEPACRAVVAVRETEGMARAFAMMERIQQAFYREGRDVTDPEVLAGLAAAEAEGRRRFRERFAGAGEATLADFAKTRVLDVHSFPTLMGREKDKVGFKTGSAPTAAPLEAMITTWIGGCPPCHEPTPHP